MNYHALPIVPNPLPDESISSWLERIAIFYGGEYDRALSAVYARAGRLPLCQKHDIDTDGQARESLGAWTDLDTNRVPALLETEPLSVLPMPARLAYCPACWDEDLARGNPPYLRRRWSCWATVHCPTHACWLSAKRPAPIKECLHDGWAPLWRSREAWASSLELSVRRSNGQMLAGFDPVVLHLAVRDWRSLSTDLQQFERATNSNEKDLRDRPVYLNILKLVRSGSAAGLRYKIAEYVDPDGYCRDLPMPGWKSIPVWSGARLLLMLMAVECLRLVREEEPVDRRIARVLRASTDIRCSLRSLGGKLSHVW